MHEASETDGYCRRSRRRDDRGAIYKPPEFRTASPIARLGWRTPQRDQLERQERGRAQGRNPKGIPAILPPLSRDVSVNRPDPTLLLIALALGFTWGVAIAFIVIR